MEPASIECASCDGKGCKSCGGAGRHEITSCARKQITRDSPQMWRMLKWVVRAEERGLLPVAGGGLDQTRSFLDSWDFIAAEMRHWDAKTR